MQRSRYKYVSNLDHARWLQRGKMFHRTAAYYRDYEDKKAAEVIGDQYECTRLYRAGSFRKMHSDGTPGEWQPMPPDQRMECITRAHEIFVFCVSLSLTDILKKEFEAVACVEIFDPAEFHARWVKALPGEAKDPKKHVSRNVKYYTENDLMGVGGVDKLHPLLHLLRCHHHQMDQGAVLGHGTAHAIGHNAS